MNIKSVNKLTAFLRDKSGVAAVEFSMIAPFMIFSLIGGGNMALTVFKHQKAVTAANASLSFLQDTVEYSGLEYIVREVKDENGLLTDNDAQMQAKLILKDAYGGNLLVEDVALAVQCACPNYSIDMSVMAEAGDSFYEVSTASVNSNGDVCSFQCSSGGGSSNARVIAQISIDLMTTDIFGRDIQISEKLNSRLR